MNELDRLVQLAGEAFVNARAVHNWFGLAMSLSDHPDHVWVRVRSSDQENDSIDVGLIVLFLCPPEIAARLRD